MPVKVDPTSTALRPTIYEDGAEPWHIEMVPERLPSGEPHPAWRCAVFVVHGIGTQTRAQVAAALRNGFDEAWDKIHPGGGPVRLPPPYVNDGWWANYADVKATFPEDWNAFEEKQREFFDELWKERTGNAWTTTLWFLKQQVSLLRWRVLREVGLHVWVLYLVLQIVSTTILLALLIKRRDIVNGFLGDVRLYAEPRGVTERAIVQRIDARVAEDFMRMIGLDREFRELPPSKRIKASGKPLIFDRVVWVSHSLGTVISYNVLSDLFRHAAELEKTGDQKQRHGIKLFRHRLRRFVTLGSPLDKFAFLFEGALRPWPKGSRSKLLEEGTGDTVEAEKGKKDKKSVKPVEWWVNFFHVLDPVSGVLRNFRIKGGKDQPDPINIQLRGLIKIPGAVHVAYWNDRDVLRYILGRTYGTAHARDRDAPRYVRWKVLLNAYAGFLIWAALIVGSAGAIVFYLIPYLYHKVAAFAG